MTPALAPGSPGMLPKWNVGPKSGIGTAAGLYSRIWFTLAEGIVTEVYYPFIDQANIRCLEFFVTNGKDYYSSEHHNTVHEIATIDEGVPAYKIINTDTEGKYRITKTIYTDPHREVLIMNVQFEPLIGNIEDYHLYIYLNPHLTNSNLGNDGWIDNYKDLPLFYAQGEDTALALGCSIPFKVRTCGYVGSSDGLMDIKDHKRLTATYLRVENGNIGLTGEVDLKKSQGKFVVALGFGKTFGEAGLKIKGSLQRDPNDVLDEYVAMWKESQFKYKDLGRNDDQLSKMYKSSMMVLQSHSTKRIGGSLIASLSIPWGDYRSGSDIGGYHLIWPRDLVESAGGFIAAEDIDNARYILFYLMCIQEADGHWAQCLWVDGTPYWNNIQMDETALPILLADALQRVEGLKNINPWPMIRKAACYILQKGPTTLQDRWEETGGYTPFTIATEIAALLSSADAFEINGEKSAAQYLRETADLWNDHIEKWTYVTDTNLAKQIGVEGYYVRIIPAIAESSKNLPITQESINLKNRPPEFEKVLAENIVSADALALVRFGLRTADDPRILNTIKVIDALLKTETDTGPVWHRYNGDGYGEHRDGSPYDGTGVGRGWPLLTGERGHYEVAKGNFEEAERLLRVMCFQANETQLIPEQIWDDVNIPEKNLINGRPTGSAMPLVWAHSEFIKLLRSISERKIFDMPPQTILRYIQLNVVSPFALWRFNHKPLSILKGKILRIETLSETLVRWTDDDWKTSQDAHSADTGLGIHHVDLPTAKIGSGTKISFTFHWIDSDHWEGENFTLNIQDE